MASTITLNEDQKRRSVLALDALEQLGVIPRRPNTGVIVLTIAAGVITTADIAESVTTKTLSGTVDDQHDKDWTGP